MQKKILAGLLTVALIVQMFTGVSYAAGIETECMESELTEVETESVESELTEAGTESAESEASEEESIESTASESEEESIESTASESEEASEVSETESAEVGTESAESEASEEESIESEASESEEASEASEKESIESETSEPENESTGSEATEPETEREASEAESMEGEVPEAETECATESELTEPEDLSDEMSETETDDAESFASFEAAGDSDVVLPTYHTAAEIEDYLAKCGASMNDKVTYATNPTTSGDYSPGALSGQTLGSAVAMLNQIRYIAGLDSVSLSAEYNALSQAGTLVNYVNGELDHDPGKPSGMSTELYLRGWKGCSNSNLAWHSSPNATLNYAILKQWMKDSDSSNIDRVGHRRWFLNPAMKSVGFGAVKGDKGIYSAAYVSDNVYTSTNVTGVAWPARVMPTDYFSAGDAWSVSIGTAVDKTSVKVRLKRTEDGKVWNFSSTSADGYFNVNNDDYGQRGCIIFRPSGISDYSDGDVYAVSVTYGDGKKLDYTVSFFTIGKTYDSGIWAEDVPDQIYTGQAVTVEDIKVYNGDSVLVPGEDYTISYRNNVQVADISSDKAPSLVITAKGNYQGTIVKTFRILPVRMDSPEFSIQKMAVRYKSGTVQKPVPVVTWNDVKLKNNRDYTVTYADEPSAVGTYEVTVTGCGNFTGSVRTTLSIVDNTDVIAMNSVKVTKKIPAQEYASAGVRIDETMITLKYGNTVLRPGTDYTFQSYVYQNSGTNYVTIQGNGTYAGELKTTFQIKGTPVSRLKFQSLEYTGEVLRPVIRDSKGNTLEEGRDYVVHALTGTEAVGTAKVSISGKGAYYGTVSKSFRITAHSIAADDVQAKLSNPAAEQPYEKNGATPGVVVSYQGRTLRAGIDYTLGYKNNKSIGGTATVIVKGKKNFKGSREIHFTVGKSNLAQVSVYVPDKVVSKKAGGYISKPVLTDTNGVKLREGKDYEKDMIYTSGGRMLNKKVDTLAAGQKVTVTITGKGNYEGTVTATYRILEAGKDLSKASVKLNRKIYFNGTRVTLSKSDITVKIGKVTVPPELYEIVADSYVNNDRKGTAKVTIRGIGEYGGRKTISFRIYAQRMN